MIRILLFSIFIIYFYLTDTPAQWYNQFSNVWSNIYSIHSIDGQTTWICGANGVILKTTNGGGGWVAQNSGVSSTLGYIYFFNENEGIAAGSYGSIVRTTDGGNNWYYASSGTYNHLNGGSVISDSLVFIVGWNGTLLLSTDKGISWQIKPAISSSNYHSVYFINENIGWASTWNNGQIWKTTNGGDSWLMKLQIGSVSLWQVYFINMEKGFAIGENGVILKSIDGGENWTQYFAGTTQNLHAITFSSPEKGWIVGKDEIIIRSTNSGDSWNIIDTGYDYEFLQVYFYNTDIGWILGTPGFWSGSPSAILYTDNGGGFPIPVELTSFFYQMNKLGNIELNWSTATENNNYGFELQRICTDSPKFEWEVVAFLPGHGSTTEPQFYSYIDESVPTGMYKYRLKQIDFNGQFEFSDEIELQVLPSRDITLEQNFPNPFNSSTLISYKVHETGNVRLMIYNSLGEEIKLLTNSIQDPGIKEIKFDASDLPSGIYFYRLTVKDKSQIKKMILMK